MTVWLDRLVDATRKRLDGGYYDQRPTQAMRPLGSLQRAVATHRPALVAEIKPGRPDQPTRDLDVAAQARAYAAGGACAISVLTDPDHFGGALQNLEQARAGGRPLLMKDFVLHTDQIDAAAAWGASAVLAIVRLHTEGRADLALQALVDHAHERGLEVLAEAFTEPELALAVESGADLVGINVRDLDTLALDPDRPTTLLGPLSLAVPALHLSGITSAADVQAALKGGADGVLVGTHLMESDDPEAACRALLRRGGPP